MKVVLKVAYEGRAFSGFQRQSSHKSVQGTLEEAISQLVRHPVSLAGAGRTDIGVHGTGQVVAFQSDAVTNLDRFVHGLNCILRDAIAVTEAALLDDDDPFHPRFSALSRTYSYFILDGCGPAEERFWDGRAWCLPQTLDLETAAEAARIFTGEQDYTTFSFRMTDMETRVRNVHTLTLTAHPARPLLTPGEGSRLLHLSITANGFLRRMVRLLTAGIVEAALGLRTTDDLRALLDLKDPTQAPHPAPAEGLYLERITYDPDPFRRHAGTPRYAKAQLKANHRFKVSTISP